MTTSRTTTHSATADRRCTNGSASGAPEGLTRRRYERFARGGAGLIWLEATAVVHEGRANPRQLWLHERTADDFARMCELIVESAADEFGAARVKGMVLTLPAVDGSVNCVETIPMQR